MNPKFVGLSIFAVVISFIGGFMLANSLNKSEMARPSAVATPQSQSTNAQGETNLSPQEITARIAEADQNPTNISYQKSLGIALYKYAGMKQDADLLLEVTRLLNRVYESDPKDYEVLVSLGNCFFDAGLIQKNDQTFKSSRKYYLEALAIKPDDLDVVADIGLIYALSVPPDNAKAIVEFEKALKADPNHERSLQAIVQAHITQNNLTEAEKFFARLQKVNPQNPRIPNLQQQIAGQTTNQPK